MLIKVFTEIYLEVDDPQQGEDACNALQSLDSVLNNSGFPNGYAVDIDVDRYEVVSDEEANNRGLVE